MFNYVIFQFQMMRIPPCFYGKFIIGVLEDGSELQICIYCKIPAEVKTRIPTEVYHCVYKTGYGTIMEYYDYRKCHFCKTDLLTDVKEYLYEIPEHLVCEHVKGRYFLDYPLRLDSR